MIKTTAISALISGAADVARGPVLQAAAASFVAAAGYLCPVQKAQAQGNRSPEQVPMGY